MKLTALPLIGALAAIAVAAPANAHGGFFRAFEILRSKTDRDFFLMRSDSWGFFYSRDGAKSWQWSCAEIYGDRSTEANHARLELLPNNRLVVAHGFRGVSFTDDLCNWTQSTTFPDLETGGESVQDIRTDGSDVLAVTSTGHPGYLYNRLWRSTDGGDHFTQFGGAPPKDLVLSNFSFAPSNPSRLYVTGIVVESSTGKLLVSDDGGESFQEFDAPSIDALSQTLRIAAIHPTKPDVLFEWIDQIEPLKKDLPDQLWMTTDAGRSWTLVLAGAGDLPGFALSPDAKTLVVSGSLSGLWKADLDALIADVSKVGTSAAADAGAAPALHQVRKAPIWGLRWDESGLWGGTDNFPVRGAPEVYTLGLSQDEGLTFSEAMHVCDVRYSACDAKSAVGKICSDVWGAQTQDYGGFTKDLWVDSLRCYPQGGRVVTAIADAGATADAGTPSSDAGKSEPPAGTKHDDSSCSLSAPGTSRASRGWGSLTALGVAFLLAARRRTSAALTAPFVRRTSRFFSDHFRSSPRHAGRRSASINGS